MNAREHPSSVGPTSLGEIAVLFARLGATVFGGPAAHVAVMEDEVVRRRGWLTRERFLDLLGTANLIPGPNSTELAIHIGYDRRGVAGLSVAGACFILPAAALTAAVGWAYVRYGTLPRVGWLLYGIKPAILAVVARAIWGLAPRAAHSRPLRALGATAFAGVLLGAHEVAVLLGAGIASIIWDWARRPRARGGAFFGTAPLLGPGSLLAARAGSAAGGPAAGAVVVASASVAAFTLPGLFGVFLKAGALLFGSGYVLLAFLRADLVDRLHWLTGAQLIDAIAVGQVTPGPVFTMATFVGYVLAGPAGAAVATAGIFLPAFVYIAASGPLVPRLRASPAAAAFLDGVNVAALALMAAVTVQLARAAFVDVPTIALGLAGAVILLRFRTNATWLVLAGAAAGGLIHLTGLAGRG
jgi:chromate transporter